MLLAIDQVQGKFCPFQRPGVWDSGRGGGGAAVGRWQPHLAVGMGVAVQAGLGCRAPPALRISCPHPPSVDLL